MSPSNCIFTVANVYGLTVDELLLNLKGPLTEAQEPNGMAEQIAVRAAEDQVGLWLPYRVR